MDETPMGTPGMPNPEPPAAPPPMMQTGRPGPVNDTSKLLAALGYVIWPVALIAILIDPYKDEMFVKFHGVQALGFNLALFVLGIVIGFIPFVQLIDVLIWPLWLVLAIVWAIKAYGGEYAEMPIIYGFVKSYIK